MNNNIDFTFNKYRRTRMFLKRPKGEPVPKGWTWSCHCGTVNALTESEEQYCPKCGTQLKIQEQNGDVNGAETRKSFTLVRVAHFSPNIEPLKT